MFESFFPRPGLFFWSALIWTALTTALWYAGGYAFGTHIGLPPESATMSLAGSAFLFWSKPFLWFYIYYAIAVGLFAAFWQVVAPHRWWHWSILGTALLLFVTYIQVEVSVVLNTWYGPFYNLIQVALSHPNMISLRQFYDQLSTYGYIALVSVVVGVLSSFFLSHYVFRWRTAMNEYYMENWGKLRLIEGAAQRIQEDTMRFSTTLETLAVSFITSVMTLIAFLPVLTKLSTNVHVLPLVGHIPDPLVITAVLWSLFGTLFLVVLGVRLPGLEFFNQRFEAAYRKELVYGEDDPNRALPPTVKQLYDGVRKSYFRLYFHYVDLGRFGGHKVKPLRGGEGVFND